MFAVEVVGGYADKCSGKRGLTNIHWEEIARKVV